MSRYHLDAYSAVERGRAQLAEFLRSSFRFESEQLDGRVHKTIDQFGLLAPPVVEATFPHEEPREGPRTVTELADAGLLHPELVKILDAASGDARWPATRPLFKHQVEAIRAYRDSKSLVVASGTGSGKTECFLLPAIDKLLRDTDLTRPGVRVLVVYPLNALVNNQMDRLRALLGHHPKIRFALYTSRLPQTEKQAQRRFRSGEYRYPSELVSREALRLAPPHILVTNFSMLEYALVRPADATLFSDAFVRPSLAILDEAHVYAGSMAAEITMLLRRAWLRWGLDPHGVQGIVTSATMHQGVEGGPALLKKFAGDILSKPISEVVAVEGGRLIPEDEGPTIEVRLPDPAAVATLRTDFATLRDESDDEGNVRHVFDESADSKAAARAIVECLHPWEGADGERAEMPPGALLWKALSPLGWVRRLRLSLHEERLRVDRIASELFASLGDEATRRQAVHRLLETLSLARSSPEALPLLPVRLHAILRGPHGIYACVNGDCTAASVPGRVGELYTEPVSRCACGAITCELRVCEGCGQSYLLAERAADEDTGVPRLKNVAPRDVLLLVPGERWDDGTTITAPHESMLVSKDGRIIDAAGIPLAAFPGGRLRGATRNLPRTPCPRCDVSRRDGAVIRRIEAGTDAALQVVLDGVYPELPEHPAAREEFRPAMGRRVLLFADNRQVAASLAAKVEESHDILLSRAILIAALEGSTASAVNPRVDELTRQLHDAMKRGDGAAIARLTTEMQAELKKGSSQSTSFALLAQTIAKHESLRELSCWAADATDDLARMLVARELGRRPSRLGNLEASGLVRIVYALNVQCPNDSDVARLFSGDTWTSLVQVLLDTLRTGGIVSLPSLSDRYDEYIVSHRYGKRLVRANRSFDGEDEEEEGGTRDRISLLAAPGRGNRRLEYVQRVLNVLRAPARVTPALVLESVWEALLIAAKAEGSSLLLDGEALRLPLTLLRFGEGKSGPQWRCGRCGGVWARHVAAVCPTRDCNGVLEDLTTDHLKRDRLVALAMKLPLLGMHTSEHTAQIGVTELAETEKAFKEGKRNLLACSTTMELGIDIGGLAATVLTNVPPGPSNYLQRAGRAGRRAEGTSLVLTFARPRPFDQAVFAQPEKPFKDKIVPPTVKLDSRRIVQRHANAFLMATFFRAFRAQTDAKDPMASLRTVAEFFDRPLSRIFLDEGGRSFISLGIDVTKEALAEAFLAWLTGPALAEAALTTDLSALLKETVLDGAETPSLVATCVEQIVAIRANVREQLAYLREEVQHEEAKNASEQDTGKILAIQYQERDLLDEKLLGYLAEEQFLPRYGFPVQVVPLRHSWRREPRETARPNFEEDNDDLRLQRDVALALNEYAPGAEVVAAKHVYASRGVLRHWTGSDAPGVLASRYIAICQECGQLQYARTEGEVKSPCPTCKQVPPRRIPVVFPKYGFAVQWGVRPRRWASGARTPLRPVTEASYAAREGENVVQVSSALWLAYDEEGQIVVRCEGDLAEADLSVGAQGVLGYPGAPREGYGYAVCYLCGRAEPEDDRAPSDVGEDGGSDPLPRPLRGHHRLRGYKRCEAKHEYWRHMVLAGGVRTETLRLQLRGIAELHGADARRLAMTLLVALQLSAGEVLGIDSRSVGGLLEPRPGTGGVVFDPVLYDQVAGGAGHCRALLDRWRELLEAVRRRLHCENEKCVNGCHRCLIAFETQRYEEHLRRTALRSFMEDKWDSLREDAKRDGAAVAPLFRGSSQLRETLARASSARIIVAVVSISDSALAENGWLRTLVHHAEGGGRIVLIAEDLPDPHRDDTRLIAERLRHAIADGRFEVRRARGGAVAGFPWKMVLPEKGCAYTMDGEPTTPGLGPDWASKGVLSAIEATAAKAICERAERLARESKPIAARELEPKQPAPGVVVRYVPDNEPRARATYDHWFRGPSGEPLLNASLTALTIVDPYLATEWQVRLLGEIVAGAQRAGCRKVTVTTYAPDPDKEGRGYGAHRTLTRSEQKRRISELLKDAAWQPLPDPGRGMKLHKRLVRGLRADGSSFEVILERGIDFITERRVGRDFERTTRETYITIRDPATPL